MKPISHATSSAACSPCPTSHAASSHFTPHLTSNFASHQRTLSLWGRLSLCGVLLLLTIALFAPLLAPYDPTFQNLDSKLAPLSSAHWLGTDYLGRDILSRLLYGARLSLGSSFVILGLIVALGVSVGGLCGLCGGRVDRVCMRVCDVFLSLPTIALSLFLVGVLGAGLGNVILAIVLTHWAWYARIVRSIVFELKHKEFILLSRTFGLSPIQSFRRHILTPILSQCAVLASMDLGHIMLHIAALSFLGLGVQAPTPEWGIMLSEAKEYMWSEPHLMIYPGLALFVSVALCNLLGEALRDYFDTRHVSSGLFQAKITERARVDSESFSESAQAPHINAHIKALHVEDLHIILPSGVELLKGASFRLKRGESLALMGRSGSGKSTLALTLQGVSAPNLHISGSVGFEGDDGLSELGAPRGFACVMQSPSSYFNPLLRIKTHFKESFVALGLAYERTQAEAALKEVGLEPCVLEAYSFELSGGMLQRVMIALALLSRAPFLIADEPSSDLDSELSRQILELIKSLQRQRGFGLLLITHDEGLARVYADKIMLLKEGILHEIGGVR